MRSLLKGAVEGLLLRSGLAGAAASRHRGRILILAYHNVVPDEDAAQAHDSLHLPLSRFVHQLDRMERLTRIVDLEDLVRGKVDGDPARPSVAITFDDAYVGALELALPELVRRDLPVTFFVCPGLLGAESFWWDSFDPSRIDNVVFEDLAADHEAVFRHFEKAGVLPVAPSRWRRPPTNELIQPLLENATSPVRFGSHSWTHPNLVALPAEELRSQLTRSREWILARAARPTDWLACPYGRNSPAVERMAEEVGFRGALEISGGWVPPKGNQPFRTPRLNIAAGLSEAGFELRLSGVIER